MSATLPRAATESEKYVIGCLVRFHDRPEVAAVFDRLTPSDFVDPEHRKIFSVAQRQFCDGGIDPVLIGRECGAAQILVDLALDPSHAPATPVHLPAEAETIIEARRKRQLHAIGEQLMQGACNGEVANDILRMAVADLDDVRREATASTTPRFRVFSAAELDSATFPADYLIDGILAANEPCALGAAEKSLKTTIMLAMGAAFTFPGWMSESRRFLGQFPIRNAKRFVMFSGESSMATHQETMRRICRDSGCELSDLDGFILSPDLPQLENPTDIEEFRAVIRDLQPDVVAVDPMMLCLGDVDEKASNMFTMGGLLRRLNEVCTEHGSTLVFAHHTSGVPRYGETPKLSWLAWSGFKQFVRQWLLLNRMEEYLPGSGLHRLKMVAGGSSGHNGLWVVEVNEGHRDDPGGRRWLINVKSIQEAKEESTQRADTLRAEMAEKKLQGERTAACRVLAKYPDGLASTTIRDRAGIGGGRWKTVLAALLENHEVVETEVTAGNPPRRMVGYKLTSNEI